MKEYNVPDLYVIEAVEEMLLDSATLEWEVDQEKNQIVVISRYEEVEKDAESTDGDLEYFDEEPAVSHFKLRPEPVEILRVDCDASIFESVREWDDEHGHHKDIVTKEQQVAFEIRGNVDEARELMGWNDDFEIYSQDLGSYTVAFRKDGLWWFLDMVTLNLMEFSVYNEEEGEYEDVPFFCESIFELNTPYTKGDIPQDFEFGISGRQVYLVCENDDVQYGLEFFDGQGQVVALNDSGSEGEQLPPWTSICCDDWHGVLLLTREEDGEVKEKKLSRGFDIPKATFKADAEGWGGDVFSAPFEYDFVKTGSTTLLRVVQGGWLKLDVIKTENTFLYFDKDDEEENELLQEVICAHFGYGSKIKARAGKDHFVVERPVAVGSRQKMQYRIIFEGQYLDGIWDDVEVIQAGDKKENFFKVKKNGYWGVINEVGTVVVPLRYTGIAAKKDEMTTVNGVTLDYTLTLDEFGRKGWGYLSGNGFVQSIPCEYEHVDASGNGWVIDEICVEKVGRVAVYDLNGRLKEEFKPGRI